jgi:rhomboid protease GluP
MAAGSRTCPHCGRLNAVDDSSCFYCKKRLPGALEGSLLESIREFSADGLAGTKLMAGICFVLYGLCMMSDGARSGAGEGGLLGLPGVSGFSGSTLLRFGSLDGRLLASEPWRLLSAVFLHGSLIHIFFNMSSLIWLGINLERRVRTARFLVLYVLSGMLGFVASWWWSDGRIVSVGASGAVFGLVGGCVAWLLVRRDPTWHRLLISNLIVAVALAFVAQGANFRIDHAAHLGGFVTGFLIGLLWVWEPQPMRRDRILAIFAGICVLASVASLVLSARSPVWKLLREREEAARLRSNPG